MQIEPFKPTAPRLWVPPRDIIKPLYAAPQRVRGRKFPQPAIYGKGAGGGGGATVAFDAQGLGAWAGVGNSTQGWTHTPVGTPTCAIVMISNFNGTGAANTSYAVTYGGVNMGTAFVNQTVFGGNGNIQFWGLVNPPAGPQSIVVTLTVPSGSDFGNGASMTFTNSDLTNAFDFSNTATNTGTSVSNTTTTAAGDMVVDMVAANSGSDTFSSPGAGQTAGTPWAGVTGIAFSRKSAVGASAAMTWALSPSDTWWSTSVSVKHA